MYGFKFPLLLTCCHMLFSFLALLPFMCTKSMVAKHDETLRRQWKGFVAIGLFMALNISLNNSSLVEMTLSLNQIIRCDRSGRRDWVEWAERLGAGGDGGWAAQPTPPSHPPGVLFRPTNPPPPPTPHPSLSRASIPVFTCLLAIGVEGKTPTRGEAASLVVLTAGVMVAVWEGTVAGSPRAVVLCLCGTVSNALMMTTSGRVLSEKVDVLRLTFYTAPVSMAALVPFFIYKEARREGGWGACVVSGWGGCRAGAPGGPPRAHAPFRPSANPHPPHRSPLSTRA